MEETVKVFSSKVVCVCGQDNAHILRGSVTSKAAEIYFWFECGHERRDIYHFHEGTTYCETQVFLKDRDWDFKIGTACIREPKHEPHTQEELNRLLGKEAVKVEAEDGR